MDLQKRSFRFSGLDQSFNFGVSLRQFSLVDRSKSVLKLSFSGQSVRVLKRKAHLFNLLTCEGEQLLDVKLSAEKESSKNILCTARSSEVKGRKLRSSPAPSSQGRFCGDDKTACL
jgi:hypothetical protein